MSYTKNAKQFYFQELKQNNLLLKNCCTKWYNIQHGPSLWQEIQVWGYKWWHPWGN